MQFYNRRKKLTHIFTKYFCSGDVIRMICIHPFPGHWIKKIMWSFFSYPMEICSALVCIRSVYFLKDRSQLHSKVKYSTADPTSIIHAQRMREPLPLGQSTNKLSIWIEMNMTSHMEEVNGFTLTDRIGSVWWMVCKHQMNGALQHIVKTRRERNHIVETLKRIPFSCVFYKDVSAVGGRSNSKVEKRFFFEA